MALEALFEKIFLAAAIFSLIAIFLVAFFYEKYGSIISAISKHPIEIIGIFFSCFCLILGIVLHGLLLSFIMGIVFVYLFFKIGLLKLPHINGENARERNIDEQFESLIPNTWFLRRSIKSLIAFILLLVKYLAIFLVIMAILYYFLIYRPLPPIVLTILVILGSLLYFFHPLLTAFHVISIEKENKKNEEMQGK